MVVLNLGRLKFIIEKQIKDKPFIRFRLVNVKLIGTSFYGFMLLGVAYYIEIVWRKYD